MGIWHDILHVIGVQPRSPNTWYNFWSGIGSDIGEVALLGAVVGLWRHHNCHVAGCWRISHRQVEGTPHVVCRKHHPDAAPTHGQVTTDHDRAQR